MSEAAGGDWLKVPPSAPGMRVALFGGSFNPPHRGHLAVAHVALRRLKVDRLWWMVTPGNPLKRHDDLSPVADRIAAVRALVDDPRIVVTALEAAHCFRFTVDTLAFLKMRRPGTKFVFVMGADSLTGLHRWVRWRSIAGLVPMAFVDRPGATFAPLSARAAIALGRWRLPESAAATLAGRRPPAWVFLHAPRDPSSSTALRSAGSHVDGAQTLVVPGPIFYSRSDEASFFQWLLAIGCVADVRGHGSDLSIILARRPEWQEARELIALFERYRLPHRALSVFETDGNRARLRDPEKFWYEPMFGSELPASSVEVPTSTL